MAGKSRGAKKLEPRKIPAYFRLSAFVCRDGTKLPKRYRRNAWRLWKVIRRIQKELGYPEGVIRSSWRHKRYNKQAGGGSKSQHLTCKAADLSFKGRSPKKVYEVAKRLQREGEIEPGGLGLYVRGGFVHVDIRGRKARWKG